jgi:hypothetical protein
MAAPRHVWVIPPQATTTELSSYAVRTVDVAVDDDLCVPGFEYHGGEEEGLSGVAQIPPGFAGERHPRDPSRSGPSRSLGATGAETADARRASSEDQASEGGPLPG